MDQLHILLVVLSGVAPYIHGLISGSVLELTVRPGDNVTLYCDCKISTGVYIVWYRNCSHENQPPLVFKLKRDFNKPDDVLKIFPRFRFVRNLSSESYDLLVTNITDSDEGLYYCGTEQFKVEERTIPKYVYRYGNVTTRIILIDPDSSDVSWMVTFTPTFTVLSFFITFIFVYHLCQKTDKEPQVHQKRADTRGQARRNQDEDVFFTRVVFRPRDG